MEWRLFVSSEVLNRSTPDLHHADRVALVQIIALRPANSVPMGSSYLNEWVTGLHINYTVSNLLFR